MTTARRWQVLSACLLAFLIVGLQLTRDHREPERPVFDSFPWDFNGYSSHTVPVSNRALELLNLTDYVSRNYTRESDGRVVNLYVGYHGAQRQGSTIHSPNHCLPANGWFIQDRQRIPMPGNLDNPLVNRMVVASGDQRQLVYYWYQGRGRVVHDEFLAVLYRAADVALLNRSDEALVRISVSGDDPAAEAVLIDFLRLVVPKLEPYIPA